ncbi:MAG: energy transducer TonB [Pseudomonadota bacterium]|nr:energy transducer TonB [Pseudomonadota bacterium]
MNRLAFIPALLVAIAAGAPAFAQDATERVADEGTIGDKWMLAEGVPLAQTVYPPHLAARGGSACIGLSYLIGKDGTTSDFQMVKAWNSEAGEDEPVEGYWMAFANAGAEAVSQWRFKPRPEVATVLPTRTVATLGFNGPEGGTPAEVSAHCRISGLENHLAALKRNAPRDGVDMNKHALDKAMQAQRRAEARAGGRRNGN